MLSLFLAAVVVAPDSLGPTYSGAAGQLKVAIPRIEAEVVIDGRLTSRCGPGPPG